MNTFNFVEKLGSIDTKVFKCRLAYNPLKYPFRIGEMEYKNGHKKYLQDHLKGFRHEIQELPFTLPTKQGRRAFLNNLYDELILTRINLTTQFKQVIEENYNCLSNNKTSFRQYFPKFLQKKYLMMARKVHQNIYLAYDLQKEAIENSIEFLQSNASNDGLELKTIESQAEDLSSPELSYIFYVLLEKISLDNKFNRANFSRIIASNFSTKKALTPQASQIRKHFTQVDASVKNRVGNFF